MFLAFWSDSHKYQCLSKLAQLGLSYDMSVFGRLHSRTIYYGYESYFRRLADPPKKEYVGIEW